MTNISEKVESFKSRQKVIMDLNDAYNKATEAFAEECQSKIDAIKAEFETKKAELGVEFEKAKESYKVDLKSEFGVTDGENANILDLVQLIRRVAGLND